MKRKKIIGILGGMGPSASGYLYNTINSLAVREYGAKKNQDFPETILYSVPVPDFISSNRNKEKALSMLKKRVRQINFLPITVMGIACNTAHILLPDLQHVSKIKFISMIDAVVENIFKEKIMSMGLLATSSTVRSMLYQNVLEKEKVEVICPNGFEQKKIDEIIRRILAETANSIDMKRLQKIADGLKQRGAKGIILGCAELPLLFPKDYSTPVFNSVEILARALLRETMI